VLGGEFQPPLNEGTLTVNLLAEPGTSLRESNRLGRQVERSLLQVPEVVAVSRRTGRAELDEHAEGVNSSELDVRLVEPTRPKPGLLAAVLRAVPGLHGFGVERVGRPRPEVLADVRERVTSLPGVQVNLGQPISHRLDHMTSGVKAQIAIKVFGPDARVLAETAHEVEAVLAKVAGVVDVQVRPEGVLPQLHLEVKRREAAAYGLAPGDVARLLETAYRGRVVGEVVDEERRFELVVWYDEAARSDVGTIGSTLVDTPSGRKVALSQVASVKTTAGPNALLRENVQRVVVVSCNVQGRDLAGAAQAIRQALAPVEHGLKQQAGSYRIAYGGQFEARQEANLRLFVLGTLALFGVFLLLYHGLGSWQAALQVMVNIPLAAIGSVIALLIVNRPGWEALASVEWHRWPEVWLGATSLTVAHAVGFITLTGIVSRNGILMISHYLHLMRHEGEPFGKEMIVRGSLERLAPVLMTASVALIGLVPLALGAGETGKEILHPLAVVVIGGLISSTLLDQVVTPALFYWVGSRGWAKPQEVEELAIARSEEPVGAASL
jgi:Cu/Ag efflux pump CusA